MTETKQKVYEGYLDVAERRLRGHGFSNDVVAKQLAKELQDYLNDFYDRHATRSSDPYRATSDAGSEWLDNMNIYDKYNNMLLDIIHTLSGG